MTAVLLGHFAGLDTVHGVYSGVLGLGTYCGAHRTQYLDSPHRLPGPIVVTDRARRLDQVTCGRCRRALRDGPLH